MFGIGRYKSDTDDLQPGDKVRVNHVDCTAGEDTRRRLYIERSDSDPCTLVYWCHNCQDGGAIRDHNHQNYRDFRHATTVSESPIKYEETIEIPQGIIYDWTMWPVQMMAWALQKNLDTSLAAAYGIGYDPQSDRAFLPMYRTWVDGHGMDLEGYQLRLLHGKGPKYTTVRTKESEGWSYITGNVPDNEVVVAVSHSYL